MPSSPEIRSPVEARRLAALHRYNILDTPPEEQFDRVVRLAARWFDVPISLIALLDSERQWLKAAVGLDRRETDREIAFCAHHIYDYRLFVVEDTTEDPRFRHNPLVTGPPGIRFYAGAPLVTPTGYVLGALCLIDTEPRSAEAMDLGSLRDLAAIVVDELELRTASRELEERNHQVQALMRELTSAEEKERHRLSELLQEELQQVLQAARLKAENLSSSSSLTGEQAEKIGGITELIEEAMNMTQGLSARFAPPVATQSLRDTFEWLAARMKEVHGLTVSVHAGKLSPVSDETVRMLLYRAVRELLFDVVKHTGVKEARVSLEEGERLQAVVEHEGEGAGLERRLRSDPGLANIVDRIEMLDGTVRVSAPTGGRTRVTVEVPPYVAEAT